MQPKSVELVRNHPSGKELADGKLGEGGAHSETLGEGGVGGLRAYPAALFPPVGPMRLFPKPSIVFFFVQNCNPPLKLAKIKVEICHCRFLP